MIIRAHTRYHNGIWTVNGSLMASNTGDAETALEHAWRSLGTEEALSLRTSRLGRLVTLCTEPFFRPQGLLHAVHRDRIGTVLMGCHGSSLSDERYFEQIRNGEPASPALFVHTLPNIVLGELSIRHGLHGAGICLLGERPCADQLITACRFLAGTQGQDLLICGWADTFAEQVTAAFAVLDPTDSFSSNNTELHAFFNEY